MDDVSIPQDCDPKVREIAEIIAAALASNNINFDVEVRSSVVHTRMYIGASKESTDGSTDEGEYYIIQIDSNSVL